MASLVRHREIGVFFMEKLIMNNTENLITQDKVHAPFLITCSFNGYIKFVRSFSKNSVVYWEFSPLDKAQSLVEKFDVKIDPDIPLRDIFSAQEVFWRKVYEAKNDY